jgi:hypothetical protein
MACFQELVYVIDSHIAFAGTAGADKRHMA